MQTKETNITQYKKNVTLKQTKRRSQTLGQLGSKEDKILVSFLETRLVPNRPK